MAAARTPTAMREIRLVVPDPRAAVTRHSVARSSASLSPSDEQQALDWIEAVSEFDETPADPNAPR